MPPMVRADVSVKKETERPMKKISLGALRGQRELDLPQVDCERASENEGRSGETRAEVARRVDLFRLRNIEFNLHIVGAKKPQEQSTGCTGLNYSKSTS